MMDDLINENAPLEVQEALQELADIETEKSFVCPKCNGQGKIWTTNRQPSLVDMGGGLFAKPSIYLPDCWIKCEHCNGTGKHL